MPLSILQALGIALGGLLSVGSPTAVFVLLSTDDGGLRRAVGFAVGYTLGYAAIGSMALLAGDTLHESASVLDAAGFVYLGLSAIFVTLAVLAFRKADDHDRPNLGERLSELTALKSFGFGLVVPVLNLKNLPIFFAAVASLSYEPFEVGILFLPLLVLIFCLTTLLPPLIAAVAPEASRPILEKAGAWIEKRGFVLSIVALAGFALVFGVKGFLILLG